ncbi:hypothetical protein SHIRM173S_05004 [Streptomyces hirsutus]
MTTIAVTTWSLEQTSPTDLLPAAVPEGDVRVVRSEVPSPEFSRFLYASVGGDIRWTDRLGWTYAQWLEHLDRPGVETWVAYDRGTPAGYVELEAQDDGVVEIVYFGLIRPSGAGASAGTCCRTASRGPGIWRSGGRAGNRPGGSGCTRAARTASTPWTTTVGGASGCST